MAEYDGLPLDTPTKIQTVGEIEVWATRTKNGGTVERRAVGSLATSIGNRSSLVEKSRAALASNRSYLALPEYPASPTTAQRDAAIRFIRTQLDSITRQIQGLIRMNLEDMDDVSDT